MGEVELARADCTASGNCPGVTDLGDGRVLVTGVWHCADGAETTVVLPAEVFDMAARGWVGRDRAVALAARHTTPRGWLDWGAVACALAGCAAANVVQDATGSAAAGDLAGLPVLAACVLGLLWWRRRGGRDG